MKLSIVIPVFNGEKYIEKCINSVSDKINNFDVEIIVVNDGSTDSTKDKLSKMFEKNKKIKIFNNKNRGVSYSRNYGISKASGKYILFLDSDDYLSTNWIELLDFISKEDFDYLICGNIKFSTSLNKKMLFMQTIGLNNETGYCFSTPWSKVYRRDFLLKNKICFSEEIINGEDELFNLKVILHSTKIKTVKINIYNYRLTKSSLTKSFNEKIFESDYKFKKELNELLKISKLSKNEQNDILDFVEYNSFKMLINRVSYVPKYSLAKKLYLKIKVYDSKYCSGIFDKIIKKLYNQKMYFCIYSIYKLKNLIRSLKKEKVIKI